MKHIINLISILMLALSLPACDPDIQYISERHACATESTGAAESSSGDESSSGSQESSTGASDELPTPSGTCPTIQDGVVEFCVPGRPCRDVLVVNASNADGTGPLSLHWHGTYESPDGVLSWDYAAQQIQTMVQNESGLMILPYADANAVARTNNPFPWWVVCGDVNPSGCSIDDDFALADEVVACVLEQELADPSRLTTSGMSAGGIMTSHLVDRSGYFAAAVSWSGGVRAEDRPTVPAGDTAVMVLHGGVNDVYCGTGTTSCYDFVEPSEALAADVVAAGNWAFLCDHQAGHAAAMGGQGAQFLALASSSGHPWTGYPFGTGGNWMLDHYCYASGDPSPWE
jgi:poly(3-hydroxybutyrate) depolymerase